MDRHLSSKQIARELGMSKTSVDTYCDRARRKLGVDDRYAARRLADHDRDSAVLIASGQDAIRTDSRPPVPPSRGDTGVQADGRLDESAARGGPVPAGLGRPGAEGGGKPGDAVAPGGTGLRNPLAGDGGRGADRAGVYLDPAGTSARRPGGLSGEGGDGPGPGLGDPQDVAVQAARNGLAGNTVHDLGALGRGLPARAAEDRPKCPKSRHATGVDRPHRHRIGPGLRGDAVRPPRPARARLALTDTDNFLNSNAPGPSACRRSRMLKQRRLVADQVAASLFEAEIAIDLALAKAAALAGIMPGLRTEAGISALIGQGAVERASEAFAALATARRAICETHLELSIAQKQMGLGAVAFGDPKPPQQMSDGEAPSCAAFAARASCRSRTIRDRSGLRAAGDPI
uniref:HTH luxR-type domain-containing protein n=1 Tax=Phenylobacterium glaciei TaxID=2803784 RepID=A0A974S8P0_9CAUL|nr:hypothetical protein JKL49_03725 [Phenylobacterium glaciei]